MEKSNRYIVSSSPHIRNGETTRNIMLDVCIALMPALAVGIYMFGMNALLLTAISVISCVVTEEIMQKLLHRQSSWKDFSAVVTGILLAFNLPATAPWWLPVIGAVFAIAIVKQLFGGLGHNFVNPALAARIFLLSSWGMRMTKWIEPNSKLIDGVTGATPLAIINRAAEGITPTTMDSFLGNVSGCLGEVSALALLIGGIYLVYRNVISPRIPMVYIGTVFVMLFILGGFDINYALQNILAGGLFLGAIFMATDYSTTPLTPKGQIIAALLCGVLTSVIRLYGSYPEGVSYSILIMNVCAPLIDRFTMPKKFGGAK